MDEQTDIVNPKNDFAKFIKEVKKKDRKKTSLTKADEKFARMAGSDGWTEFKKLVIVRIERLKSLRDYDSSGKSLEDLGLRFLVADLVASEITNIIGKVDGAKIVYDEEKKKD